MNKPLKTSPSLRGAFPDRAITIDELSEMSGLSKHALYHLRSRRPSALPPPLVGDAYRNSAMYLLSTAEEWLRSQEAKPVSSPTPMTQRGEVQKQTQLSGPARPGRPRKSE